jgi:uncharacterized protein YjbI with pentapeptide repeats
MQGDGGLLTEDEDLRQELETLRVQVAALQARLDAADAARAQLDAEKLRADMAKTAAETAKLNAEKSKVDAETTKLNADQAKTEADLNPTAANNARGTAELAKLQAETEKLKRETRSARGLVPVEWFKTLGAIGVAAGAIGTVWVAFSNYGVTSANANFDHDIRHRAEAAELVKGLYGDAQPGARMAAAVGLRAFLEDKDSQLRALAIDGLTYGLVLENDRDVQQAIEDGLANAGAAAEAPLIRIIKLADADVRAAMNQSTRAECPAPNEATADDRRAAQRQGGMVDAVLALSRIKQTAPDFSDLNLKCYPLYTATESLRAAHFQRTILWQTDLYNIHLENGDFTDAVARNAKFNRAHLDATIFNKADLKSADFSGATGLTAVQLRAARSLECAKLDAPLAAELATAAQGQVCHP